jgi:O-methyltransferase
MRHPRDFYLDLIKRVLTGFIYEDPNVSPWGEPVFDAELRRMGADWPRDAHTMVGLERLNNIQSVVEDVLTHGVPGDFLEAGAWRGGASIFMRALLAAHAIGDRRVWVADSFQGLPPPDSQAYPADSGDPHSEFRYLAVSLDEVRCNFARYGLLDEQVCFLPGWFKDTLPTAPIDRLAVLRLDADMYGSTREVLTILYPRVSPGGYVIVDDYGAVEGCRRAVADYRQEHGIADDVQQIDWTGVYWRKTT